MSLDELEAALGYGFTDRALLRTALCHASYKNEHPGEPADNERFEFLGDAVLDLVVGQRLMERWPQLSEGQLSVTRAQVVSEQGLADVAVSLSLGNWLLLGRGEERSGGRSKPSLLADAFEAIVAAVFLDAGFDRTRDVVTKLLHARIESVEFQGFFDFKTRLQEAVQERLKVSPMYQVVGEAGPDHDKRFTVAVLFAGREWARSTGRSKKEAEQAAAAAAHFQLEAADVGLLLREMGASKPPSR